MVKVHAMKLRWHRTLSLYGVTSFKGHHGLNSKCRIVYPTRIGHFEFRLPISENVIEIIINQQLFQKHVLFVVSTVPADGLASFGAS